MCGIELEMLLCYSRQLPTLVRRVFPFLLECITYRELHWHIETHRYGAHF